jgi:hypothetical protein
MVLLGQPNATKAIGFLTSYFNYTLKEELFDIQDILIEIYRNSIPASIYGELLSRCTKDTPKMQHAIVFQAILSNEDNYMVVLRNLDTICLLSEKLEVHVYAIFINSFAQFIKDHYKEILPQLFKKKFTPFIKGTLTRTSLLKLSEGHEIFDEYFNWVLSCSEITFQAIESEFINVIAAYDPCCSVNLIFSGQMLATITALIGLIHFTQNKDNKKSMYEELQKTISIICQLSSVPVFEQCDSNDLSKLANNCQILAECILRIPNKKIRKFFMKAKEMFDKMEYPVISSVAGVSIFVLSRLLNDQKNGKLRDAAIEFTSMAMENKRCCDFLYICAARAFNESNIDSLPSQIIASYTKTLGNSICNKSIVDEERIKFFCIMVRKSAIAMPYPIQVAFSICPEETINTLIEIQEKNALDIYNMFMAYFSGISSAMQLIQMKTETDDMKEIARTAVQDVNLIGKFNNFLELFRRSKNLTIVEWICLFVENMSNSQLENIKIILMEFSIELHKYMSELPEVGKFITRILKRVINEADAVENEVDAVENEVEAVENEADPVENETDAVENETDAVENEVDAVENEIDAVENEADPIENEESNRPEMETEKTQYDAPENEECAKEEEKNEEPKSILSKVKMLENIPIRLPGEPPAKIKKETDEPAKEQKEEIFVQIENIRPKRTTNRRPPSKRNK